MWNWKDERRVCDREPGQRNQSKLKMSDGDAFLSAGRSADRDDDRKFFVRVSRETRLSLSPEFASFRDQGLDPTRLRLFSSFSAHFERASRALAIDGFKARGPATQLSANNKTLANAARLLI